MAVDHKAQVMEFLTKFHDNPDLDALGAYFTQDATYQPIVPDIEPVAGRDAIIGALKWQYETYYDCICEIHACAAEGSFVFTERSDHVILHAGDRKVSSRVCAVFECNEGGLIVSWREYWDTGNVARQMGIAPDQVLAASAN